MDPGGVLELDVMQNFRAAYSRLCHDAVVHAVHWECWVAAMRNVIGLFSVATEWAEATACLSMPGASPGQCADALVVLRQMRDSTTGMQRRLEHLVLELRSGVEAKQRVALVLLLRWCGREPREGDFGRYVWGEAIGAAAASGQRPREVADGSGRAEVAEPTGHAEDAAGRAAKCSYSPVAQRAPRRACAAAGVLLWMGAGTNALASAPSFGAVDGASPRPIGRPGRRVAATCCCDLAAAALAAVALAAAALARAAVAGVLASAAAA